MTHAQKLKRIEALLDSPDVVGLHRLIIETSEYEREHYPIPLPTIAEAMRFRREQMGETRVEIAERAGLDVRVWSLLEDDEVDDLTISEARKLFTIGIPAEVILSQGNQSKP
jgi:HTH-type transcriptional regulator/antitoxin HigA